jgi:hypothetical protein
VWAFRADRASSGLRALEQANEVWTARAELKKDLASGTIELVQILADPPPKEDSRSYVGLLLVEAT